MSPPPDFCPPLDPSFKRKLTILVVFSYAILAAVFCLGVFAPVG
ncbi:MAG TPA: hypothetical protein VGA56_06840 [Opitutaceae bacterium]